MAILSTLLLSMMLRTKIAQSHRVVDTDLRGTSRCAAGLLCLGKAPAQLVQSCNHSVAMQPLTFPRTFRPSAALSVFGGEETMNFGRGALLWLLGVPLPIILLLALFWHH